MLIYRRLFFLSALTTTTTFAVLWLLATHVTRLDSFRVISFHPRQRERLSGGWRRNDHDYNGGSTIRSTTIPITTTTTTTTTALACQLLGMNCAQPTDFNFSFQGFCKRGGDTDVHAHGWGVVFYQDGGIRQFHDMEPASTSPLAQYLGQTTTDFRTLNMMGHIRFATQGALNLANQHPFTREMWGLPWCFCHNGEVPLFINTNKTEDGKGKGMDCNGFKSNNSSNNNRQKSLPKLKSFSSFCTEKSTDFYHPVGTTDSEATFCAILNALRCRFTTLPSLPDITGSPTSVVYGNCHV